MADVSLGLSSGQEFVLGADEFDRIRKLIYDHAGISLSDSKRQLVHSRLGRRLRQLGLTDFGEYIELLERGDSADEWQAFTNALTTNLTSFFREEHHFPVLAEHARKAGSRPLTIWCSAASTGEEPYSIAITMAETFGTLTPPVRILATDVDTNVLATADRGVYPMDRFERMSPERMRKFFQKGSGANAGHARVRRELRELITFRPLNLLHDNWPIRGPLDVIFCRNVMIYFDKPTQYGILKKFAPLLRGDGLMFAGHSENFIHAADLFRLRGKTVYELSPKYRQSHASA